MILRLICLFFVFNLSLILTHAQSKATNLQSGNRQESTFGLLHKNYLNGNISVDEWALNTAYAMFVPDRVNPKFRSPEIEKCGSWILDQFQEIWPYLKNSTKNELEKFDFSPDGTLSRPGNLPMTSETDHFTIHYTIESGDTNAVRITDSNLNGIPDYIDSVRTALEYVWNEEIGVRGFTPPPPDNGIGGSNKYDVYIYNFTKSWYGYVTSYVIDEDNPNSNDVTEIHASPSFMGIRNNYDNFKRNTELENIQVTVAHEFLHSIQNGYDRREKAWLKEATATWIEDEVYDDINDNYQYMTNWFRDPEIALDADKTVSNNHWYGSWIFFRYLSENYGAPIIKLIWEKSIINDSQITDFSMVAIEQALNFYGSTFANSFHGFTITNLLKNIAPYVYEEGEHYPNVYITRFFTGTEQNNADLMKRSCRYYKVSKNYLTSGNDEILFEFSTTDQYPEYYVSAITKKGNVINVNNFSPGSNSYTLNNSKQYDDIWVIVSSNTTGDAATANYFYSLKTTHKNSLVEQITGQSPINYFELSKKGLAWTVTWDSLYYTSFNNFYSDTEISNPKVARNSDEIFFTNNVTQNYILNAYSNYARRQLNSSIYSSEDNPSPPKFGTGIFNIQPQIDEGYVWASGLLEQNNTSEFGTFKIKISDATYQKVSDKNLADTDQLFVDGNSAVWLYYNSFDARQELDLYKNGSEKSVAKRATNDFYHFRSIDFDDNLIVWKEEGYDGDGNGKERVLVYNISNSSTTVLDSALVSFFDSPLIYEVKVGSGNVVWSMKNATFDSSFIYLWNSSGKKLIYQTPDSNLVFGNNMYSFTVDNSGIAWIDESQLYLGTNIFCYYKFSNSTTSKANVNLGSIDWNFGKWYMRNGEFFFQANNMLTLEEGIFRFKMDDFPTGIYNKESLHPDNFSLYQNFPNPFNPTTKIQYTLPYRANVAIEIFDILGKRINILVNKKENSGTHEVIWTGKNDAGASVSGGVYFYRLNVDDVYFTKKMILLK